MQVRLYDTTLRDGAQGEGISFSLETKLRICERLARFGVHYIEGGWPGANPKDTEFFERMCDVEFEHATVSAFGSTRRKDTAVEEDVQIRALLDTGVGALCIFGKSWDLHVTEVLKTSLEENVAMVADTVRSHRAVL